MADEETPDEKIISYEISNSCELGYNVATFHLINDHGKDVDLSVCSQSSELKEVFRVIKAGLNTLYPGRVFYNEDKGEVD